MSTEGLHYSTEKNFGQVRPKDNGTSAIVPALFPEAIDDPAAAERSLILIRIPQAMVLRVAVAARRAESSGAKETSWSVPSCEMLGDLVDRNRPTFAGPAVPQLDVAVRRSATDDDDDRHAEQLCVSELDPR